MCGADEGAGVDVVAAGVRDAGHLARPRVRGGVLDRQRVEVGPQGDDRVALPQVGDQPGLREAG